MNSADVPLDVELAYPVSFRRDQRAARLDAPPRDRFEMTGSQRLARAARHARRGSGTSPGGMHRRGQVKAYR